MIWCVLMQAELRSSHVGAARQALCRIHDDWGTEIAASAVHLAPLAGRGRIASKDAIRVRGYRSHHEHFPCVCPSPRPSPREERGEGAHRPLDRHEKILTGLAKAQAVRPHRSASRAQYVTRPDPYSPLRDPGNPGKSGFESTSATNHQRFCRTVFVFSQKGLAMLIRSAEIEAFAGADARSIALASLQGAGGLTGALELLLLSCP